MTIKKLMDYRSNVDFEKLKQEAANMTPEQLFEQRVSGIYGLMSSKSKVTKDEIREEIKKMNPGLTSK